ncbi:MAG TPA: UdgX family uracil-DNA binding protein [Candidatus Dormibacteraeota bacterium]
MGEPGQPVEDLLPDQLTIPDLAEAAHDCKACDLWEKGTQTVFGEGSPKATVMLLGEQPGDQEDLQGRPFVGPAGHFLDRALEAAGIDRNRVYVTNVVKHFKWTPRGKRRIHATPNRAEVGACVPWLRAEVAVVQPRVIVCLGATAAKALLGPKFKVTEERGRLLPSGLGPPAVATVHPASILRSDEDREQATSEFVADLKTVAHYLEPGGRPPD